MSLSSKRWSGGPRVNEVEPILVIFEDRKEKEQVVMMQMMQVVIMVVVNVMTLMDGKFKQFEVVCI